MNWYYAAGGEQLGPVSADELAALARSGAVTDETLVWREGLPDWEPFASHRALLMDSDPSAPPAGDGAAGPGPRVRCSVCGGNFAPDDIIILGGHRTCAACKPVLLQRLEQGAVGVGAGTDAEAGQASEEQVATREYSVDATGLVGEAWNLVFSDPAVLLLGPILGTVAYYALVAATSVLNLIPFAGGLVSGLLISLAMGPYLAGIYALLLARLRGQPAEVAMVFAGCTRRVKDLLLSRLYLSLFTVGLNLVILLAVGSAFIGFNGLQGGPGGTGGGVQLPTLSAAIGGGVAYLLVLIVYMYFAVCWVWAVPLVFDKGYGWQEALRLSRRVVGRHWWQHFWMMFLGGLLVTAGVIVCCVGALVAIPVFMAMLTLQYRRLFEDLTPADGRS